MLIYLQMIETPEEKSKFEQIYLQYKGLMFQVAFQILHNEQDAEDAVHQAFVKIAENIRKIDQPVCPKTHGYVVTMCRTKPLTSTGNSTNTRRRRLNEEIQGNEPDLRGSPIWQSAS